MTGIREIVVAVHALCAVGCGCSLSHTANDGGGSFDGTARQDGTTSDGTAFDGSVGADGSTCLAFGEDRVCGEYCYARCPPTHSWCNEFFHICQSTSTPDVRGRESCGVSLTSGHAYCYSGKLCAVMESWYDPETADWSTGACVDEGYCQWVRDGGGPPDVRCRYSEGEPYENGPPDQPCASGADPNVPFCGGACGDTCPYVLNFSGSRMSCVGISEERGFGVCSYLNARCTASNVRSTLQSCEEGAIGPCLCMILPSYLPEFSDRGWPVAHQTCLAYRDAFPDQVRCLDASWTEL